jgi:hypothetical protein
MRCLLALVLFLSITAAGCQQYSTALQQGAARPDDIVIISTLRTIDGAQKNYSISNNGQYGSFPQLVEGGYLDQRFSSTNPVLKGYVLDMKVTPNSYSCNADSSSTERRAPHYYIDSTSAEIHVNTTQPATAADETIR